MQISIPLSKFTKIISLSPKEKVMANGGIRGKYHHSTIATQHQPKMNFFTLIYLLNANFYQ